MSRIQDLLDFAVKAGRQSKVQSAQRGERMMAPTFIVYRGDRQVAIVVAGTEGRNDVLPAARMCIVGLAADVLVMAIDTFTANVMKNPLTGESWGPGEMQLVADKHHGIERGWVSDAVHVMAVNRAEDMVTETIPYRKDGRHRVKFGDAQQWIRDAAEKQGTTYDPEKHSAQVGGVIPDALRRYMVEPVLTITMANFGVSGETFGLTAEQARAHEDLVVARMMTKNGCTVALSSDEGTERSQVLADAKDGERM